MISRIESDDEMNPGEGRVRKGWIIGRNSTAIGLSQQGARLGSQARIVSFPRDIEQDRGKPAIGVNAFEQPDPRAVIEVKYGLSCGQQITDGGLEHLVPGVVFDDVFQAIIWSLSQIGGDDVRTFIEALLADAEDDDQIEYLEDALANLSFTEDMEEFNMLAFDPDDELTDDKD